MVVPRMVATIPIYNQGSIINANKDKADLINMTLYYPFKGALPPLFIITYIEEKPILLIGSYLPPSIMFNSPVITSYPNDPTGRLYLVELDRNRYYTPVSEDRIFILQEHLYSYP